MARITCSIALGYLDEKEFVRQLNEEEKSFYEACEVLISDFFSSSRSKDEILKTVRQRCFNEFMATETFSDELVKFGYELDRGLFTLIARQVEDEALHYDLLAKVIERLSDKPLDPKELKPTKAQQILGYAGNDLVGNMAFRFCAEGRSAFLASLMIKISEKINLPDMAAAYKVIERDEIFHKKIGEMGLEMVAKDPANHEKIREAIRTARERAFSNFYEIYGPNQKALEIYVKAYGQPKKTIT